MEFAGQRYQFNTNFVKHIDRCSVMFSDSLDVGSLIMFIYWQGLSIFIFPSNYTRNAVVLMLRVELCMSKPVGCTFFVEHVYAL